MERIIDCKMIAQLIAEKFVERFENSKAYFGEEGRIIRITPGRDKKLFDFYEEPQTHDAFVEATTLLAEMGICSVQYDKMDRKLIRGIEVDPNNKKAIALSYSFLGKRPKKELSEELANNIDSVIGNINDDGIRSYLEEVRDRARIDGKIIKPFDGSGCDFDIIKMLIFLSSEHDYVTERVLSRNLFGDTKYFEKTIKTSVVSILRKISDDKNLEASELLSSYGVIRYPEEFMFGGRICLCFNNGDRADLSALRDSVSITSDEASRISSIVSASGIGLVTTVENKANYFHLLRDRREDELVVFVSGFQSPAKTKFLGIIYQSFPEAVFRHAGDLEVGGFDIFVQVRNAIPKIVPYQMDRQTLEDHIADAMKISDERYIKRLITMRGDEKYAVFYGVIDLMIEKRIRFEQEALLQAK